MLIKTASWFTTLPDDHLRMGISRRVPRRMETGFRVYRRLAPGAWFNSFDPDEYYRRYRPETLGQLNPRDVASELAEMANGRMAVLVCFERPGGSDWCHRAMAA